ncbi:MAG: hypothetical protein R6W84_10340 [Promethearchaeia archaeon]
MNRELLFGKNRNYSTSIFLFFILFVILFNSISIFVFDGIKSSENKDQYIKQSAWTWATLDLTNPEDINNSRFSHFSNISIEGRLYNKITEDNKSGEIIVIEVDGNIDTRYSSVTNINGIFQINYTIDPSLDVYSPHIIKAKVQDLETDPPGGEVEYDDFYRINVNATSYLDVTFSNKPYLPDEEFDLIGYLRYNNENGNGIPGESITYYWTNGTYDWIPGNFLTNAADGSISEVISLPINPQSIHLFLNLSYPGDLPNIKSSQIVIGPFDIFYNISCTWNMLNETSEGGDYTIRGQIWEKGNPSRKIYNRQVNLYYEGEGLIGSATTDANGNFSFIYSIPPGTGNKSIRIQLVNTAGLFLTNETRILITAGVPILPPGFNIRPFQWFFIIGLPIIIGIIAALGIYGYFYYKKEISASRLVNIPLEGKIRNLKILKDSGRIEEALSYLFNAIYVELVGAKYGRKRKFNETIRDFAIISVQDFKLDPAKIYPFIQKIEQIIYAQPFKVTEEEFYKTIELFSPVYYQLTGYKFILNF